MDGNQIEERRKELGWSQAKLAEAATELLQASGGKVNQQTIDRIEKGSFSRYKDAVIAALAPKGKASRPATLPSDVVHDPSAPSFASLVGPRDVPELGIAVGGEDGDFEVNGSDVLGYVPRPPALHGRDIFAVRVKNDSMFPRHEEGDLLYVERRREPSPGEDAIVEMHPTEEGGAGRAFIKRLVSKGMASVVVKQFNPERTITYDRREVKALYRVVPRNELLGA